MASNLDGAGQSKMATLDEALATIQRLHATVERFAVAVRTGHNTGGFRLPLQRMATPLVGLLKPQFGAIADQVSALILVTTRAGTDQAKLRALREAVAQLRAQLDIAVAKVKERHTVPSTDSRAE